MILQELIRNIVLYRGLINPLLQLVKENMFALWRPSYLPHFSNIIVLDGQKHENAQRRVSFSFKKNIEMKLFPLNHIVGTHTIPIQKSYYVSSLLQNEIKNSTHAATDSNETLIMLRDDGVQDYVANSAKTNFISQTVWLCMEEHEHNNWSGSTTGFSFEKCILYLSHETHEKREYLGEFSLTHEEIQFNSMKGRG